MKKKKKVVRWIIKLYAYNKTKSGRGVNVTNEPKLGTFESLPPAPDARKFSLSSLNSLTSLVWSETLS